MGKSELARKFAAEYFSEHPCAAWIQAETKESLDRIFREIATLLGLNFSNGDTGKDISLRVFSQLVKHIPSSLFIYDNANVLKSRHNDVCGIFEYIPLQICDRPPSILITSRRTEWRRDGIQILKITALTNEESLRFFHGHFELTNSQLQSNQKLVESIDYLSKQLQGYPLGLQLAAGNMTYIPDEDPISVLERDIQDLTAKLTGRIDPELMKQQPSTPTDYPNSFQLVWEVTMDKLHKERCSSTAIQILQIVAYCSPDNTDLVDLLNVYKELEPGKIQDQKRNNF